MQSDDLVEIAQREGIRALIGSAIRNTKDLKAWLIGLRDWLLGPKSKKERPLLILGAGGVGKSTLGQILSNQLDFLSPQFGVYTESIQVEKYPLAGAEQVEIVVAPGQQHRRASTWGQLLAGIENGEYRGIILVGAYGFHTLGEISYKNHAIYKPKMRVAKFVEQFTRARRKQECAIVKELAPALLNNQQRIWLLNLVTKQDLWWRQRDEVTRFYSSGAYGKLLTGVEESPGGDGFCKESAFCSLLISRFMTAKKESLMNNAGGYDELERGRSILEMYAKLDKLRAWEKTG